MKKTEHSQEEFIDPLGNALGPYWNVPVDNKEERKSRSKKRMRPDEIESGKKQLKVGRKREFTKRDSKVIGVAESTISNQWRRESHIPLMPLNSEKKWARYVFHNGTTQTTQIWNSRRKNWDDARPNVSQQTSSSFQLEFPQALPELSASELELELGEIDLDVLLASPDVGELNLDIP